MTSIEELTTLLTAMLWEKHKGDSIESITEDIVRIQRLHVRDLEETGYLLPKIAQVTEDLHDALRHLKAIRMPRHFMQALSDDATRIQYDRLRRFGDTTQTHSPPFEGSVEQTVSSHPPGVVPNRKDTPD